MSQSAVLLPVTGTVSGLANNTAANNAMKAALTMQSGASAPTTVGTGLTSLAGILWHDTTTNSLKIRDQADGAWMVIGGIDETGKIWLAPIGGGTDTIASASTTDIGTKLASNLSVTGTTTITSFGSTMLPGQSKIVTFPGVLTLTYDATSMILQGAANITTAAGDSALVSCVSAGNYKVVFHRFSNSGVTAGAYTNANVTIDSLGKIITIANGSGGSGIQGNFKHLQHSWVSNTTTALTFDQMLLQNSSHVAFLANTGSLTLNTATSGANGLDTGSLAANTWYYVYVIYNGTTVSCLMSASSTAPTLPSGYTFSSGPISAVYLDGSKNIIGFTQFGRDYQFVVGSNLSGLPSLATGSAGTVHATAATFVSVAIGTAIPLGIAGKIKVCLYTGGGTSMAAPNNSYGGYDSLTNTVPIACQSGAPVLFAEFLIESGNIYWASNSSGNYMNCLGFTLNI
jgi:hypothetical protein